ncbi:DUF5916 domain-containing protein [Larkinella punicea]|uniref:DUF5916 domain-containing protein n=1 Tax=Larkinella punicea TaxID=2315727 RepID=UPI0014034056|nr:DUF5916 domain-containing protein [Larkinella punicea]
MKNVFLFLFLLLSRCLVAQPLSVNETDYALTIRRATEPVKLDGQLDEADWQLADSVGNFRQFFPYDTANAESRTVVRVLFDGNFLYVGAVCYQPRRYVVTSLKRDFLRGQSDLFEVNLDPFRDKLNGVNFAVSPYGVQREGLITNGQEFTTDWDNKWYVRVTNDDDRYTVEMAIPFKTLRYKLQDGQNVWLINFIRSDITRNEISAWAPIPRNFNGQALAFSGRLVWAEPPPRPGSNVSLIPYTLVETGHDFQSDIPTRQGVNVGFDAKVAVTPSLNLDLTVNPDFAQVEVDQQVTNLSRFELFFPERRQFFLENSDLFGSFGTSVTNPFFSRRIGLARNPRTGFNEQVPILAGVRLSGRLDRNWRIGVLNTQTGRRSLSDTLTLLPVNYGMLAVQRRISTRSFVSAMLVNKDPVGTVPAGADQSYNRVAGLEYSLASANNQWRGKAFYHRSFSPDRLAQPYAMGALLFVDKPAVNGRIGVYDIGDNFRADVGYAPRTSLMKFHGETFRVIFPKGRLSRHINRFYLGPNWDFIYGKRQNRLIDWDAGLFGGITLQNQSQLTFAFLRWDYTYLFSPFDPSNTGGATLPANTSYLYFSHRLSFVSNVRKPFFFSFNGRYGQYFNGRITQLHTILSYRQQPYGIFSLDFTYNGIRLPAPYSQSDLLLIGPKVDLSFTRSVFLTAYAQYNNQINNVNTNIRFQWRYKPVSDLFVVYTDNYFAYEALDSKNRLMQAWQPKNRALVVKLTYWLNL